MNLVLSHPQQLPWADGKPVRHSRPRHGPMMLVDLSLRGGRPTNVNHVLAAGYIHLDPGYQIVPRSREWDLTWTPERAALFEVVSNRQLYDEDASRRGRPRRLSLELATSLRERYWTGELRLAQIVELAGFSNPSSAHHLCHGVTYWYAG